MSLNTIINFRSTEEEKRLMIREAARRGATLSAFLTLLWEEDKDRRLNAFRMKNYVRMITRRLVKQGILKRTPCVFCGNPKVEAHHEDYLNPYKVRWLCRDCHCGVQKEEDHVKS